MVHRNIFASIVSISWVTVTLRVPISCASSPLTTYNTASSSVSAAAGDTPAANSARPRNIALIDRPLLLMIAPCATRSRHRELVRQLPEQHDQPLLRHRGSEQVALADVAAHGGERLQLGALLDALRH